MLTKTIKVSQSTHDSLSRLASKNDTFNDVIAFLIRYYCSHEELTDEEAELYKKEIEKFEDGNLDNVTRLTLEDLEKRISKLETELRK